MFCFTIQEKWCTEQTETYCWPFLAMQGKMLLAMQGKMFMLGYWFNT
jgi:hypothetical protein